MTNIDEEIRRIRAKLNKEIGPAVRIALYGQPGAGKSSLINALVGSDVAEAGVPTDMTVGMTKYEHNGVELCDLPGFGTKRFPKEGYWREFGLDSMDLLLCVFAGKLHGSDIDLFNLARTKGKVCLLIRAQADSLWQPGRTQSELHSDIRQDIAKLLPELTVPLIFTSNKTGEGMDELQSEIAAHLEPAKRERWQRGAAAYSKRFLSAKKKACEKDLLIASLASAVNGLNPVPGLDIAIDLSVLLKSMKDIRANFGLYDEDLHGAAKHWPVLAPLVDDLIRIGTRKGALEILKRMSTQQATKQVAKYVPILGQAVAAGAGFGITYTAGMHYLDLCHQVAERRLTVGLSEAAQ